MRLAARSAGSSGSVWYADLGGLWLCVEEIEETLGPRRYFPMESSGKALTADANLGQLVVQTRPRSPFSRTIRELVEHVRDQHDAAG